MARLVRRELGRRREIRDGTIEVATRGVHVAAPAIAFRISRSALDFARHVGDGVRIDLLHAKRIRAPLAHVLGVRLDAQRLVVVGDRAVELHSVVISRAAARESFVELRLELDRLGIVGDRTVEILLVVPAAPAVLIGAACFVVDLQQGVRVRDDLVVFTKLGQRVGAVAVGGLECPAGVFPAVDHFGAALDAVLVRGRIGLAAARARRQFRRFGRRTAEAGEKAPRGVVVRVDFQRPLVVGNGLVLFVCTLVLDRAKHVVVGVWLGAQLDDLGLVGDGTRVVLALRMGESAGAIVLGVLGLELDRAIEVGNRIIVFFAADPDGAAVRVGVRGREQPDRLVEVRDGGSTITLDDTGETTADERACAQLVVGAVRRDHRVARREPLVGGGFRRAANRPRVLQRLQILQILRHRGQGRHEAAADQHGRND